MRGSDPKAWDQKRTSYVPPPNPAPFIFLLDNVPSRVVSRLRRRWLRLLLLRILRKIGALETLEVWGMEKEVGLWEVIAPLALAGVGNGKLAREKFAPE